MRERAYAQLLERYNFFWIHQMTIPVKNLLVPVFLPLSWKLAAKYFMAITDQIFEWLFVRYTPSRMIIDHPYPGEIAICLDAAPLKYLVFPCKPDNPMTSMILKEWECIP